MKKIFLPLLLFVSLATFGQLINQDSLRPGLNNTTIHFKNGEDSISTKAIIWLPVAYQKDLKYPLVVYGHSNNQAGNNITTMYQEGLPAALKQGAQPGFDCIIICPQRDSNSIGPSWLLGIFDYADKNFNIDTTRIYLTGNSAGALMCFGSLMNISEKLANKIAAICVVSGDIKGVNEHNLEWWVKSRTPVWSIIGRDNSDNFHQNILLIGAINSQVPGLGKLSIRPSLNNANLLSVYNGQFTDNGENLWSWLSKNNLGKNRAFANVGKRIMLRQQSKQVYCKNVARDYNPLPGDTLVVPIGLRSFLLQNFVGNEERPIVIIPEDSGWIGGYPSYSANISKATYFKITGFHIDGLNISGLGLVVGEESSNYEIANCYIKNIASIGLVAKHNPNVENESKNWPNFTIRDVSIHDLVVRHTGTEALYIGYTFDMIKPLAPPFDNLSIYNIDTDSSGWDGVQLSNCQNVSLRDIKISNFGLKDKRGQQAGLLVGSNVTFKNAISNIQVSGGSGPGMVIFGRGKMFFRNITLRNIASSKGESAVYVDDFPDLGYGLPSLQLNMRNIKVEGSGGNAMVILNRRNSMIPGKIEKFNFTNTNGGIIDNVNKISK